MLMKIKTECISFIMVMLLCFTNAAIINVNKMPEIFYEDIHDITIEIEPETDEKIGIDLEEPININEITDKYKYFKPRDINTEISVYEIPNYRGFKAYMSYALFSHSSDQYLVQELAATNSDGLRVVDDRYCIAIGTHFDTEIGQYIDLILENGTVISCIVGDKKAPQHTDPSNIFSLGSGCASEFIVDTSAIHQEVKQRGDVSLNKPEWESPVVEIRVYENNVLEEERI